MQRKHLIVAIAASLGLAGAIAYAANRGAIAPVFAPAGATTTAYRASPVAARGAATPWDTSVRTAKPAPAPPPPTVDEVGDVASFGRNVRWLGVVSTPRAYASTDCAPILAQVPGADCRQITNTATYTILDFERIASIRLPAKASNSLLCHWLSRTVNVRFNNPTAAPVQGRMVYTPYFTVENPVLDDPALIDPTTGAPFGGELNISLGSEDEIVALLPNLPTSQTRRDAMVCQYGMVSKRTLVETYGLTPAQADSFFANPTTVWVGMYVQTRYAENVSFNAGLRIVGD